VVIEQNDKSLLHPQVKVFFFDAKQGPHSPGSRQSWPPRLRA